MPPVSHVDVLKNDWCTATVLGSVKTFPENFDWEMEESILVSLDKLPIRRLDAIEENGFERFPAS